MNQKDLIIIDVEKKGNAVRFYLGSKDCKDYWGDDWNDHPYEHNAGTVYERFVQDTLDMCFPFVCDVLEPCDGTLDSGYSREDMKKRRVPCLIIVPKDAKSEYSWKETEFRTWANSDQVVKIYFGDSISVLNDDRLEIVKPISDCIIKLADNKKELGE
jgi:hypothetical protein